MSIGMNCIPQKTLDAFYKRAYFLKIYILFVCHKKLDLVKKVKIPIPDMKRMKNIRTCFYYCGWADNFVNH